VRFEATDSRFGTRSSRCGLERRAQFLRRMTHERVRQPLGRIVEFEPEHGARMSLNEFRDLLEALDDRAYTGRFRDGQRSADEGASEPPKRVCADGASTPVHEDI
jgi:hypothetical protein